MKVCCTVNYTSDRFSYLWSLNTGTSSRGCPGPRWRLVWLAEGLGSRATWAGIIQEHCCPCPHKSWKPVTWVFPEHLPLYNCPWSHRWPLALESGQQCFHIQLALDAPGSQTSGNRAHEPWPQRTHCMLLYHLRKLQYRGKEHTPVHRKDSLTTPVNQPKTYFKVKKNPTTSQSNEDHTGNTDTGTD